MSWRFWLKVLPHTPRTLTVASISSVGRLLVGESRNHHRQALAAGHQLQHELLRLASASCRARRPESTPTGCLLPRSSAARRPPAAPGAARRPSTRKDGRRISGREIARGRPAADLEPIARAHRALAPCSATKMPVAPSCRNSMDQAGSTYVAMPADAHRVVPAGLGARHPADLVETREDGQRGRRPGSSWRAACLAGRDRRTSRTITRRSATLASAAGA